MGFKDQPFSKRWEQMGDKSESAYLNMNVTSKHDRFGWDRTPINTSLLPAKWRYMPDFISTYTSPDGQYNVVWLTECVGLGRDGLLKFKMEKLEALKEWADEIFSVYIFVYDSHRNMFILLPLYVFARKIKTCPIKHFPEGKAYYEIDVQERFQMMQMPE